MHQTAHYDSENFRPGDIHNPSTGRSALRPHGREARGCDGIKRGRMEMKGKEKVQEGKGVNGENGKKEGK